MADRVRPPPSSLWRFFAGLLAFCVTVPAVAVAGADTLGGGAREQPPRPRLSSHGTSVVAARTGFCSADEIDADACALPAVVLTTDPLPVHAYGLVTIDTRARVVAVDVSLSCGGSTDTDQVSTRIWRFRVPVRQGTKGRCDHGTIAVRYAVDTTLGGGSGFFQFSTQPASPWHGCEVVLGERHAVSGVQVAAGPRRLAVVVWKRGVPKVGPVVFAGTGSTDGGSVIQVAVRQIDGRRFLKPATLARRADGQRLAMTPSGETVVTWRDRQGRIIALFRPPEGPFGDPTVISPAGTRNYSLAIGPDGTAVVAWELGEPGDTRIEAVIRSPGGPFGTPATLSGLGAFPVVAVNAGGGAVVAWEDVTRDDPAHAVILEPGGAFAVPERIPGSAHSNAGLEAAMDDGGTAVVLVNGDLFRHVVKASVREPGGTFSRATSISGGGDSGNFGQLGVDAAGVFHAAWDHFGPPNVAATTRPPGASWEGFDLLGRRRESLEELSVGRAGQAVVLTAMQPREDGRFRIRAIVFMPGLGWGPPEPVSPLLAKWWAPSPAIAVNPRGVAIAAWGGPADQVDRGVFVAERWP